MHSASGDVWRPQNQCSGAYALTAIEEGERHEPAPSQLEHAHNLTAILQGTRTHVARTSYKAHAQRIRNAISVGGSMAASAAHAASGRARPKKPRFIRHRPSCLNLAPILAQCRWCSVHLNNFPSTSGNPVGKSTPSPPSSTPSAGSSPGFEALHSRGFLPSRLTNRQATHHPPLPPRGGALPQVLACVLPAMNSMPSSSRTASGSWSETVVELNLDRVRTSEVG